MMRLTPVLASLLCLVGLASAFQGDAGSDPRRQFDFWVGEWECWGPNGTKAGENTIHLLHGGTVLLEEWRGSSGNTGSSLNLYDSVTGRWHQTWAGGGGQLLLLDGGLQEDGSMLMTGERPGPAGARVLHRVRWTPGASETVQQHWQMSRDAGATWSTVVDLTYARPAEKDPEPAGGARD